MNHWEGVLERQLDLWKWWGSLAGIKYGEGFATSYAIKNPSRPDNEIVGQLAVAAVSNRFAEQFDKSVIEI